MTEPAPLLSEEQRQRVLQWKGEVVVMPVERWQVRRFAEAIGDPNPLWSDDVAARKSRYGGLITPPTFLRVAGSTIPFIPEVEPFDQVLDAGSEWEYEEQVHVGDVITSERHVRSVSQRRLGIGPAIFLVFEATYRNQLNQVVARQRSTLIRYKGAS